MVKDMTQGSTAKLLLLFSVPLLIGNVFQQFYNFADTAIVGKTLGNHALAAVGSVGSVMFLVFGFFFGLTSGLSVVTGQRFGANDPEGVRKSAAASVIICSVITALSTAACVLLTPKILRWMNTPPEIMAYAKEYLLIMFWGTWSIVFYGLFSSILRALGDTTTPLVFLIVACLLNVALDLIFILFFHWGVGGAAWATVISQVLSGFLCLIYVVWKFPILRLHWCNWNVCTAFYREHLRVALPMAFQFSITAVGIVVLQAFLNDLGTDYITATTVAAKMDQLSIQPIFSFGIAMAAFAAQNYGARNVERIRHGVWVCSLLSLAFAAVTGAATAYFVEELAGLFMKEGNDAVIRYTRHFIYINCSFYGILTMLLIYRNVLQGIGHTFCSMMAGVAELVIRIIAAFFFVRLWGFTGVCFAHPMAWFGATTLLWINYLIVMHKLRRDGIPSKDNLVRRTEAKYC